jgi:hypothetical protein
MGAQRFNPDCIELGIKYPPAIHGVVLNPRLKGTGDEKQMFISKGLKGKRDKAASKFGKAAKRKKQTKCNNLGSPAVWPEDCSLVEIGSEPKP